MLGWLTFGAWGGIDWLGNPSTALPSIMAMSIWQAVGFHMVIWLAGLQTISPTLHEAADVEGASPWQKFRYVTWPGPRNTAVPILIVITMQAFSLFAQVDMMTNGGPLDSTQVLVPGGRARLWQAGHLRRLRDQRDPVPDRPDHQPDPALAHEGEVR